MVQTILIVIAVLIGLLIIGATSIVKDLIALVMAIILKPSKKQRKESGSR